MSLLRTQKVAIDEVWNAVNNPEGGVSVDPRADKDWVNPWAQKGTESLTAAVAIHETPKHLPQRDDMRTHMDEEEKDELKSGGKVGYFKSALLRRLTN